jgi:metal-responsive CopG/Arc/MetJ family transcriptional regulator
MAQEKQLVNIKIEVSVLERLEQFRERRGMDNRSDAMRWLLKWALDWHDEQDRRSKKR